MEILFDMAIQNSSNRNFKYSLLCKPFWIVKGKKKYIGDTVFVAALAAHIHPILTEYKKTNSLTGENLKKLNYYLARQKTSVQQLNKIFEEIN